MQVIESIIQLFLSYWIISFPILLVTFAYLAFRRRFIYNGIQETIKPGVKKRVFTDAVTNSTFYNDGSIVGVGKTAQRRKNFGKPAWSWPTTIIVAIGIILLIIPFFY